MDLRDRAVLHAFVTGALGKVVTVVAGLVSVGIAVRYLGESPYGIIAALVGVTGLFGFLDLGVGNGLLTRLSRAFAAGDENRFRADLTNGLCFLAAVGGVFLCIAVPVVLLLPSTVLLTSPVLNSTDVRFAYVIFVLAAGLSMPAMFGTRVASAMQRGAIVNVVNLAASLMSLVSVGILCALDYGFVAVLCGFLAAPVAANLGLTWIVSYGAGGVRPDFSSVRIRSVLKLVPAGLPFSGLALAGAVSYQTDTIVVAYVVGASGAAVYGVLQRLFNGISVFFSSGVQQFWASVAHALEQGRLDWVRRTFWRVLIISSILYLCGLIVIATCGDAIVGIMVGSEINVPLDLVIAFSLWSFYGFIMGQLSSLLNGAGLVKAQSVAALIMMTVNLPLSVYLTKTFGMVGPLYGSLVAHALIVGLPTLVLTRRVLSGSN